MKRVLHGHRISHLVAEGEAVVAQEEGQRYASRRERRTHMDETFEAHQQAAAAKCIVSMAQGVKVTTFLDRLARARTGHPHTKSVGAHGGVHAGALAAAPSAPFKSPGLTVGTVPVTAGSSGSSSGGGSSSNSGRLPGKEMASAGPPVVPPGKFEGYNFESDESCVHFDLRVASHESRHELKILAETFGFVVAIGGILGVVAACITFFEGLLINGRNSVVQSAFAAASPGGAYLAFSLVNTLFICVAACLTYWAPMAVTSGLPPLKAFLNGVDIPDLLSLRTLIAKTVGVTFVVATGIPLGREGPMVHTGAAVAARVTRFKMTSPWELSAPLEVRVPSAQRSWVGIGCAAGVAAAFSSPLGGILYSFEEVRIAAAAILPLIRAPCYCISLSPYIVVSAFVDLDPVGMLTLERKDDVEVVCVRRGCSDRLQRPRPCK